MYDLFKSLRKPGLGRHGRGKHGMGVALGAALGLLTLGQTAQAANPLELNFWLSGPKYDGRVAPCQA
ncbi:MAG TPA: hypothetical protein VHV77_18300, partial [Pirellulales bacterium]|nr:hypothetical protein [Pirellulales bacterium]